MGHFPEPATFQSCYLRPHCQAPELEKFLTPSRGFLFFSTNKFKIADLAKPRLGGSAVRVLVNWVYHLNELCLWGIIRSSPAFFLSVRYTKGFKCPEQDCTEQIMPNYTKLYRTLSWYLIMSTLTHK